MSELRTTYLGTLGIAALFLAAAVALVASGSVDERVTPLWNLPFLAAASLGPAYAAPRMPLRALFAGGLALGLLYATLALWAAALSGNTHLPEPMRLFAWAIAVGAGLQTAAGILYRWLARRSRRAAPPAG